MRRATVIPGVALPAAAMALVALVYGVGSDQPSGTVEPWPKKAREEARRAPSASSTKSEPNESTVAVPPRSTGSAPQPAVRKDLSAPNPADINAAREQLSEEANHAIRAVYPLLIRDLGLTPEEKEGLLSLLIELRIAGTWTWDSRGRTIHEGEEIGEQERANRIAAIIGEQKLQQFLARERNLFFYGEVYRIGSLLHRHGVPLADSQRDGMLKILLEVKERYWAKPPGDIERSSIEYLEYVLAQRGEFQRHVMELAPSVLSAGQVRYLFQQYQDLSYERAAALERQKEAAAKGDDGPWSYPAWHEQ